MTELTADALEAMSRAELVTMAHDHFGLSFTARQSKADIVAALTMELGLEPAAPASAAPPENKVMLRIARSDKDGEPEDVFVGANGRNFLIKRGEWVEVPEIVANILRDAVQTVYDRKESKLYPGRVELVPREAESYPFQTKAA